MKAHVLCALCLTRLTVAATGTVDRVVQQRHNAPPTRPQPDLAYPTSQNSALMQSSCRPERDGYFGGTYAASEAAVHQLHYGVALETAATTTSNVISHALAVVRDHVMDVVVSATFPAVCTNVRQLEFATTDLTGITGYRFGLEYDALDTCTASDASLYCGIFVGTLTVYGANVTDTVLEALLAVIVQQLPAAADAVRALGVLSLAASPSHCAVIHGSTGGPPSGATTRTTRRSIQFGLILLALVIVAGIIVVVRFLWLQHAMYDRDDSLKPKVVMVPKRDGRDWMPRFLYDHDGCDATHVSNATSLYSTNSALDRANDKYRREPAYHDPYDVDSIYIVEPDEEGDTSEYMPWNYAGEYGSDPLGAMHREML